MIARGGRSRGFTLLEILVVIVIIGVLATFAVMSVGSRALDDRLDLEARRLQELLALAADEAVLQGVELGFAHTPDGYLFLALREGRWQPVDGGPLRARGLQAPFFLTLAVEGRSVAPLRTDDPETELAPQVLLLSSGDATEFTLQVRAQHHPAYFRLAGDTLGRLTLERQDAS